MTPLTLESGAKDAISYTTSSDEAKQNESFQTINQGYGRTFKPDRLSLGLVVPLERYPRGPVPTMVDQLARIQQAEALGFSAVWLRDVPFNVPSFGDAGQLYDPFVYLGYLAGQTKRIALGVASIVLPLRHPAHVAKAAASADVLSGGRIILGVASGDRPQEYPALNLPFSERGRHFREAFQYLRNMEAQAPTFENHYGSPQYGMDLLPKPFAGKLPLLITGSSRQSMDWIMEHGDGWMLYPRPTRAQAQIIKDWRAGLSQTGRPAQPVMEPLYIDLTENPHTPPRPIHLGIRCGVAHLHDYLKSREDIGVNHVALNLRFNQIDIETTLTRLADHLLPAFSA